MTYPKAIVISAALLAAAIAFAAYQPAQSALGIGGRYMLGDNIPNKVGLAWVWLMDTETGELRACYAKYESLPAECDVVQKKW